MKGKEEGDDPLDVGGGVVEVIAFKNLVSSAAVGLPVVVVVVVVVVVTVE